MGSARVYGRSQVNSIFLLSSLLTFLQTPTTRTRTSQHHSSTRTAKRKPSSDLRGARYSVLPKLLLLQYGRWVLTYTKKKKKKKNVPASKENPRDKLPPPYVQNICVPYIASHVEVYSANAVPGGFARAPFQDPASALYPLPPPRGPMGTTLTQQGVLGARRGCSPCYYIRYVQYSWRDGGLPSLFFPLRTVLY